MEHPQLDLNTFKVELEELEDKSYIVHATETTDVRSEDAAANEFTGGLM